MIFNPSPFEATLCPVFCVSSVSSDNPTDNIDTTDDGLVTKRYACLFLKTAIELFLNILLPFQHMYLCDAGFKTGNF